MFVSSCIESVLSLWVAGVVVGCCFSSPFAQVSFVAPFLKNTPHSGMRVWSVGVFRIDLSYDDLNSMLANMGFYRDRFVLASLTEASGLIHFLKMGGTVPQFTSFPAEKQKSYNQRKAVFDFVRKSGYNLEGFWTDKYGLNEEPKWDRLPDLFQVLLDKQGDEGMLRRRQKHQIEKMLIGVYHKERIQLHKPCHMGHLIFGLLEIFNRTFKNGLWNQHVCLVDIESTHAKTLVAMQQVDLIMGIVCSDHHWAFCLTSYQMCETLLFDGKKNPVIQEKAEAWHDNLPKPESGDIDFMVAMVPPQSDDWSCGHRVLLGAWYALNCVANQGAWSNHLPSTFASENNLDSLIDLIPVDDNHAQMVLKSETLPSAQISGFQQEPQRACARDSRH